MTELTESEQHIMSPEAIFETARQVLIDAGRSITHTTYQGEARQMLETASMRYTFEDKLRIVRLKAPIIHADPRRVIQPIEVIFGTIDRDSDDQVGYRIRENSIDLLPYARENITPPHEHSCSDFLSKMLLALQAEVVPIDHNVGRRIVTVDNRGGYL